MVAEINDPLYYDDTDDVFKQNVLLAATCDYNREVMAYLQLSSSMLDQGIAIVIPAMSS